MRRGIRQVLVLPEIILNMEHDIRRSEETQDIRKNVQQKAANRREFFEEVLQSWSRTLQKERYNKSASGCRDTERENNMNETSITTELLAQYAQQLYEEEKSSATIEKYIRDVRTFSKYAGSQALTKDLTIAYKRDLPTRGYNGDFGCVWHKVMPLS